MNDFPAGSGLNPTAKPVQIQSVFEPKPRRFPAKTSPVSG